MASGSKTTPLYTNRLAEEKSTYLLQHAHNPVDWYPWGDEAIAKAKAENKLIFLSVGYSTCHWCHVMEKESFENDAVAKVMNHHFVNVKVDREERPDIDRIYMNFVVMINGSGGWPMSVWLTPDLAPISAGTYYPPVDRWGTPGFTTVLNKVYEKWQNQRADLTRVGLKVIDVMSTHMASGEATGTAATEQSLATVEAKFNEAVRIFERNMDPDWGGFGGAPKFPEVSKLSFMLHAHVHQQSGTSKMLELVRHTLQKISDGGIHDHVFGGFSRYAVDRKWHVPHFEKMLYDQGQLMGTFATVYQMTGDTLYLNVADDIFRYICQDLHHPDGGFFCGEDADSYPEFGDANKIEGAFYAWTWQEVRDLFDEHKAKFVFESAADVFCHYYGVKEGGNVEPADDPQGHLLEKNIMRVRTTIMATAAHFKTEPEVVQTILDEFNAILHAVRDKRPRPHLDTKIITAWNGLVLSGLAKLSAAGGVDAVKRADYVRISSELVTFIKLKLYNKNTKTLLRSCYGEGTDSHVATVPNNPIAGFLDDYAFLIRGLLDFYVVSLDVELLRWARDLQSSQDRLFWDTEHHGYFYSQANARNVVIRLKDDHDGAEPCGNSVTTSNLLRLAAYFEDDTYSAKVTQQFAYYAQSTPFGYVLPEMMSGLLLNDCGTPMLVVAGPSKDARTVQLLDTIRSYYIPGLVLVHYDADDVQKTTLRKTTNYTMIGSEPTVYLCHNQICELPITGAAKLVERLSANYLFK